MSSPTSYSYDTRLNVLHDQMTLIDEKTLADAAPHKWYNQTLCQVNASVVRLGVIEGEYHGTSTTTTTNSFTWSRVSC